MNSLEKVPAPRAMRTAHQAVLRREMEMMVSESPRHWRRSGAFFALSAIVATGGVAAAAAAAVYLHYENVSNTNYAHCYSLPRLGDNGTTIAAVGAPGSHAQVTNALGTCGMLWQDGFLAPGVSHAIRVTGTTTVHSVPHLVVCTMPNGTAGVFPGTASTCQELGLAKPKPSAGTP